MDRNGKAAFAAVEVIIWRLVAEGSLRSEPLAAELERYSEFSGNAAGALQVLAKVARAARPHTVAGPADRERESRRNATVAVSSIAPHQVMTKPLRRPRSGNGQARHDANRAS
jgi:hypothetical protein